MNYYEHHLGDYIKDTVGLLTMIQEGAYRRLIDQYYARELPLPLDLKECHKLARATTAPDRAAVDYVVAKFFKRTTDGYRQKRCDEEIERYTEGEPDRVAKRESNKERKRRSRERRAKLFGELAAHGITPAFDASITDLEARLSQAKSRVTAANGHTPVTRDGMRDGTVTVTPVTDSGTATQSQSPVPSEDQSPKPPLGKGASRRRRSGARAEADAAAEIWSQLLISAGAQPARDSKLQAAINAVGGWSRIAHRTDRETPAIKREFCDAYRNASP